MRFFFPLFLCSCFAISGACVSRCLRFACVLACFCMPACWLAGLFACWLAYMLARSLAGSLACLLSSSPIAYATLLTPCFCHALCFQNQAKIQKMIEQEAIDQNYHMAMEEAPEVFARVSMLYIDTEVTLIRNRRTVCTLILNEKIIRFRNRVVAVYEKWSCSLCSTALRRRGFLHLAFETNFTIEITIELLIPNIFWFVREKCLFFFSSKRRCILEGFSCLFFIWGDQNGVCE